MTCEYKEGRRVQINRITTRRRLIDLVFADDRKKPENKIKSRPSELLTIFKSSTQDDKDIE
jgi:hypothetical protein